MERPVDTNRSDDFIAEQTSNALRSLQEQFAPTDDFAHHWIVETVAVLVADLRHLVEGRVTCSRM